MNLLFLTLLYPPKTMDQVSRFSKDGMQNQINSYQWAYIDGLRQNMGEGEDLNLINSLPVGIFPIRYKKLVLPSWREPGFSELGSLNLPGLKQWARQVKATKAIVNWARKSASNRQVLVYTLYLPYMQAVANAKKQIPDLKATVIVTDLPNELGISSGRQGLMKRLEHAMGNKRTELCQAFDGFVLLTHQMEEVLPIQGKNSMVMEGLILPQAKVYSSPMYSTDHPVVLYTGTLNRELGIGTLLDAFKGLSNCQLWLCGAGDMQEEARQADQTSANIRYFGVVSQEEAIALQGNADILINPRSRAGLYTRYSFPSKTLEYMRSGRPVLCYHLEGIPRDYDPYLVYIRKEGAQGIREAVEDLLALPKTRREEIGKAAQTYVQNEKNPRVQCEKLVRFLRGI